MTDDKPDYYQNDGKYPQCKTHLFSAVTLIGNNPTYGPNQKRISFSLRYPQFLDRSEVENRAVICHFLPLCPHFIRGQPTKGTVRPEAVILLPPVFNFLAGII